MFPKATNSNQSNSSTTKTPILAKTLKTCHSSPCNALTSDNFTPTNLIYCVKYQMQPCHTNVPYAAPTFLLVHSVLQLRLLQH